MISAIKYKEIQVMDQPLSHIDAIVLAGGLGTRLRKVLLNRPKSMATVNGRPFIIYLLDFLCRNGIRRVILCTGYLGDQIKDFLGISYNHLDISYSNEIRPMGTAGALRNALNHINSEEVIVFNGDSICIVNLNSFISEHRRKKASASMLLSYQNDCSRFGAVEVNPDGWVCKFTEKHSSQNGYINAGSYILPKKTIAQFPDTQPLSMEYDVLPTLVPGKMYGHKTNGAFIDIGLPDSLKKAGNFFTCHYDFETKQIKTNSQCG